ncbi:protein of unknown function [Lactiplantibacillus plantarum]
MRRIRYNEIKSSLRDVDIGGENNYAKKQGNNRRLVVDRATDRMPFCH